MNLLVILALGAAAAFEGEGQRACAVAGGDAVRVEQVREGAAATGCDPSSADAFAFASSWWPQLSAAS